MNSFRALKSWLCVWDLSALHPSHTHTHTVIESVLELELQGQSKPNELRMWIMSMSFMAHCYYHWLMKSLSCLSPFCNSHSSHATNRLIVTPLSSIWYECWRWSPKFYNSIQKRCKTCTFLISLDWPYCVFRFTVRSANIHETKQIKINQAISSNAIVFGAHTDTAHFSLLRKKVFRWHIFLFSFFFFFFCSSCIHSF